VTPDISTCQTTIDPMGTCSVLPPVDTDVACVFTTKGSKVRAAAYVFDTTNGSKLTAVVPATK
jgi:hypothetical protein